MVCANIWVVDNVVYMGTVNNSNKTWHVLMCVVNKTKNRLEKVIKVKENPACFNKNEYVFSFFKKEKKKTSHIDITI